MPQPNLPLLIIAYGSVVFIGSKQYQDNQTLTQAANSCGHDNCADMTTTNFKMYGLPTGYFVEQRELTSAEPLIYKE